MVQVPKFNLDKTPVNFAPGRELLCNPQQKHHISCYSWGASSFFRGMDSMVNDGNIQGFTEIKLTLDILRKYWIFLIFIL